MKTYTLSDLKKILKEQGYKYVGLFDTEGKPIISYNHARMTPQTRLEEIEKRMKASGIKDGFYVVKFKNTPAKKAHPDDYVIKKGNPKDEPTLADPPPPSSNGVGKELMPWDEALKLTTENVKLKLEKETLEKDLESMTKAYNELCDNVDEMEKAMAEMEEEAEEKPLADSSTSWVKDLTEGFKPLLTSFVELEDRKLKLKEAVAYKAKHKELPPAPEEAEEKAQEPKKTVKDLSEDEVAELWTELKELHDTDEKEYIRVMSELKEQGLEAPEEMEEVEDF